MLKILATLKITRNSCRTITTFHSLKEIPETLKEPFIYNHSRSVNEKIETCLISNGNNIQTYLKTDTFQWIDNKSCDLVRFYFDGGNNTRSLLFLCYPKNGKLLQPELVSNSLRLIEEARAKIYTSKKESSTLVELCILMLVLSVIIFAGWVANELSSDD